MLGSRQHRAGACPCLAPRSGAMDGHVIEADPQPLAGQPACDVHAQRFASGGGLRDACAGLVEGRARYLELVARPKLLV
jgi:hypothetical protein